MYSLLLLALLTLQGLSAQIVTATSCVHQSGDNPDWARPDFDDSQWSAEFPKVGNPFIWTRCHLDLSSLPSPVSVGVEGGLFTRGRSAPPATAWELFVDGQAAGSFGDLQTGFSSFSFELRPLPAGAGRQRATVVALRQVPGRFIIPALRPSIAAGHPDSLRVWHSEGLSAALWRTWPSWAGGAFTVVIGMVLLLLFFFSGDRSQRSLLWFGLYSVCYGFLRFQEYYLVQTASGFPNWLYVALWGPLTAIAFGTFPNTFFCMTGRRVPTFYSLLAAASVLFIMLRAFAALFAPIQFAQQAAGWGGFGIPLLLLLVTAPAAAFWPFSQVSPSLRLARNLSLLFMLGLIVRLLPQVRGLEGFSVQGDVANFQSIVALFVLLGLFVVIARQNRQVALDRAELQGEMKSAQEVQQLLTSSVAGIAPWAEVQVAYLPAKEVGGDFYFLRETPEGQLIVVGDVSGKGLRAAMLASVALGSLRTIDTSSPAHLLYGLNNALHGQTGGGFVTCSAALFRPNGEVSLASGGHPSPYLDGREVPVESGLPLGVVANATYEESKSQGAILLLVSDGVVEAENAQRELFGFERTREMSMKTAPEIAEAARAWGQTDDITVVTVRRKP
jgi:sigma-B regulation protein RsbU (phosphoserine phosphatase)